MERGEASVRNHLGAKLGNTNSTALWNGPKYDHASTATTAVFSVLEITPRNANQETMVIGAADWAGPCVVVGINALVHWRLG